jgi:hypothetical protein
VAAHGDALTYAGSSVPVTSVNWTWEQPYALERFFLDGSGTRAKPVPNGIATVTGTMAGEYVDQVLYAAYRAGTFASLVATATGTTAISGGGVPDGTDSARISGPPTATRSKRSRRS